MIRAYFILVCVMALTACAGVRVNSDNRHVRGFDLTAAREAKVAAVNAKRLDTSYREEWRYNRRDQQRPPQLCLAMSGGGMRSAAFNIGVLKGLHQAGVLDQVDVLSAVSGGSYAMSWYYLQQASTDAQPEELFDDNGRFQQYLSNHSNLAYSDPDSKLRWFNYVWVAGKWLPSLAAHIFANGLFDWRANLNPLRRTYENGIERVFHVSPASTDPERDGFVNKAGFFSASVVDPDKAITFPRLREFIEQRKLPFFVVNATVAIDDDPEHYAAEFAKAIYEFTPLWHGSDAFDRYFTEFPFGVSRAVALSGAAKDSATTPGVKRQLFDSMTNTDLGYFISNPDSQISDAKNIAARVLPFPFYLAVPNYRDAAGTDIYLTDGGHSDNLATFSLVRRMCGEIIVVDAEHDPEFQFQGLRRLKKRLFSEMGVGSDLPETLDPTQPVTKGAIGSFPVQFSSNQESRNIAVKYLKLSIDPKRLEEYSPTVQKYYRAQEHKASRYGRFPQESTVDINYSPGQFLAYRDLGADMVRMYLDPLLQTAHASEDTDVRQAAALISIP